MSKTKDTSNLATLEDHRPLADSELNAVTGGAVPKLYEAACKELISPRSPIQLW